MIVSDLKVLDLKHLEFHPGDLSINPELETAEYANYADSGQKEGKMEKRTVFFRGARLGPKIICVIGVIYPEKFRRCGKAPVAAVSRYSRICS
jgi:hypothetical protein